MFIYYKSGLRELNQEIEGIGAVYTQNLSFYSICKYYNIELIHHIHQIGHNYNNIDKDEWDKQWDDFFNFKSLCRTIDTINLDNYKLYEKKILHKEDVEQNKDNECIFFSKGSSINESERSKFLALIKDDINKAYDEVNYNRPLIYNKNKKNIAIHIRVWNDCDSVSEKYIDFQYSINSQRYKYDENKYISIINKIINKYPDYDIHIFTQESFKIKYPNIYANSKFNMNINMNAFDTLHHMIKADVLVLGVLSAFSILAAYYNKNTIIYTNDNKEQKFIDSWLDIDEF